MKHKVDSYLINNDDDGDDDTEHSKRNRYKKIAVRDCIMRKGYADILTRSKQMKCRTKKIISEINIH